MMRALIQRWWLCLLAAAWVQTAAAAPQPESQSCGALLTCDVCTSGQRTCRLIDTSGQETDAFVERCNAQSATGFPRAVAAGCCPEILCEPCRAGRTSCRIVGPAGGITDVYVAKCAANGRTVTKALRLQPEPGRDQGCDQGQGQAQGQAAPSCLPQILCEPCAQGLRSCRVVSPYGRISDVYVERCGH